MKVKLREVIALCNPVEQWIWDCDLPIIPITKLVSSAPVYPPGLPITTAAEHAGRVRWFMVHGWHEPITVDIGVPDLGYPGPDWMITDGNHRLAAAILLAADEVSIDVCGSIDHARNLFHSPPSPLPS